jgi:nitrogen regulatory protein P-II 1
VGADGLSTGINGRRWILYERIMPGASGTPRIAAAHPVRYAETSTRGRGRYVKLVIGIVRPEKANDVLEALYRAEVRGLSISRVQGHGGELDRVETYRGTTVKMGLADKVRFEIAVSDSFVEPTIEALCESARTGEVGDGKIFVLPLERAVRIRTGETDRGAVTPVGE